MKYLLGYLEAIPDAPSLTDPDFQQLLVDVQAGKPQAKNIDAFYDSLEKVVAELRASPEAAAFARPVSKREAADYYQIVRKPMDLQTISKNIKAHKYKNKAEFADDLNLIWDNCALYNHEAHPLRAAARFLKQKADHHLEFLADRAERTANPLLPLLPPTSTGSPAPSQLLKPSGSIQPSSLRGASVLGEEDDAAGESDAGDVGEESFRSDGLRPPNGQNGRGASRDRRGTSVMSLEAGGSSSKGNNFRTHQFRPNLQTNFDVAPALIRTPYTMTHFLPIALHSGPSWSDKGKAKEVLSNAAAPAWYPAVEDDFEDIKLEGSWWGSFGKDEAYVGGLPGVPIMTSMDTGSTRSRKGKALGIPNGHGRVNSPHTSPRKSTRIKPKPKPVYVEEVVHDAVDSLFEARKMVNQIQDFQKAEQEGLIMPRYEDGEVEAQRKKKEGVQRKRKLKEERVEASKRRKKGGEVGEKEAILSMKRAAAGLLAHAGFDGANEAALDLFARVAADNLRTVGRTFRLLMDRFSNKMTSEEIILHSLHENGDLNTYQLESHLKDDIQKESVRISDMRDRIRQGYKEVATAPTIGDDMIFADDGEMLLDGNFTEDLGEDFLGLRESGIAQEFGLQSLNVPSSLFYGRGKRATGALAAKLGQPEYPPPPPFIPLNANTLHTHLPALLHGFFAARQESGLGLADDPGFEPPHNQIGSLGQIVNKSQTAMVQKKKKKENGPTGVVVNGGEGNGVGAGEVAMKKKKNNGKKPGGTGVGRGNWIRPSKEEKAKKSADKQAPKRDETAVNGNTNGDGAPPTSPAATDDAMGEDEDAEGEEE